MCSPRSDRAATERARASDPRRARGIDSKETNMKRLMLAMLGAVLAVTGCATPSVHPIFSKDDAPLTEPGLVGAWKQSDSDATYTVSREGDGYRLIVRHKDDAGAKDKEHVFTVRLVKIGDAKFADFSADTGDRGAIDEKW